MTAPTEYRSTDASAPQINSNAAGTIIGVLDAVLVNGYGAKAAAGWTKPYSDTNRAAYYMAAGGTSDRMYLYVDDTAVQQARVRGFESMGSIDPALGTNPFPTVAQFSGGMYLNKSSNVSATNRPWIAWATPTTIYLFIEAGATTLGSTGQTNWGHLAFGEYATYVSAFTRNVMIMSGSSATITQGAPFGLLQGIGSENTMLPGHYIARAYTDAVGSVGFTKLAGQQFGPSGSSTRSMGITAGPQVPSPVTGKIKMRRVRIAHLATHNVEVGHLLGVWCPMVEAAMGNPLDTIAGSGALAGKTFVRIDAAGAQGSNTNVLGQACIDITDFD